MTDRDFEDEAAILLDEYGRSHGEVAEPPIPIEEIIELHLELRLTFDDMQQLFGVEDVHGALWVNERRVGIDQRLVPTDNPSMLGRYRFTLAHEVGHWRLHRHLFERRANQPLLLPDHPERAEYICRSSDTDPIEYQANRFASCLLMPQAMIKAHWIELNGNLEPIYLDDLKERRDSILAQEAPLRRGSSEIPEDRTPQVLLEHASRPLAQKFHVSAEAMRIRLDHLGLLRQKRENLLF